MSNGSSDELRAAVAAQAEDTPYQMIPTATGFDLRIDVIDAQWGDLLRDSGIQKVVEHRVALDETQRTMTITDIHLDVRADAGFDAPGGGPRLMPSAIDKPLIEKRWGRIDEYSTRRTFGLKEGAPLPVGDFTFDSAEGHDRIRIPAAELGWTEKAGSVERIARVFGIIGGAIALAVLGALAYGAATGKL
ncbi:hypothetical protein [Pengzhenrongella sp.]|jgi:hypothetical protein|uniref:hypothetical protein n=1 Tax=Pengzhenrongella sp. TaxID=2888820 RepID=UPI002F94A3E9